MNVYKAYVCVVWTPWITVAVHRGALDHTYIAVPTNLNPEHPNQRRRVESNSIFYTGIGVEPKRYQYFTMAYRGRLLSNQLSQLGPSLLPLQTRIVVIGFGFLIIRPAYFFAVQMDYYRWLAVVDWDYNVDPFDI